MAANAVNDDFSPQNTVANRCDLVGTRFGHDTRIGAEPTIHHGQRPHTANLFVNHGGEYHVARQFYAEIFEKLDRHQHTGHAAFHVDGTASVDEIVNHFWQERVGAPMVTCARWHHVNMAGQHNGFPAASAF